MSNLSAANLEVVRRLHDRLIEAFEAFATEMVQDDPTGGGLYYVDALMGCHNFYKRVILDLERRCPESPIRDIAVATLAAALGVRQF